MVFQCNLKFRCSVDIKSYLDRANVAVFAAFGVQVALGQGPHGSFTQFMASQLHLENSGTDPKALSRLHRPGI